MDVILPESVEFLRGSLHKHDSVYRSDIFVAECPLFTLPVFFPVSVTLLRTVIFGEFLTDPLVLAQEQVRIIAGCPLPGEIVSDLLDFDVHDAPGAAACTSGSNTYLK